MRQLDRTLTPPVDRCSRSGRSPWRGAGSPGGSSAVCQAASCRTPLLHAARSFHAARWFHAAVLLGATLLLAPQLPAQQHRRQKAPQPASLGTTVGSTARPARASGATALGLAAGACRLGRWAAAVDLMRVVPRSERSADAWLCLARAQRHTGEWVAALDSYDELAESADQSTRARSARQLGGAEREELETQLAWIRIMPTAPLPRDAQLTLDGEALAPSLLGVAFPIAPGTHELALEVDGGVQKLVRLRFEQGERRRVPFTPPNEVGAEEHAADGRAITEQRARRAAGVPNASAVWSRRALLAGSVATGGGLGAMLLSGVAGPAQKGVFITGTSGLFLGGLSLITGALLRASAGIEPDEVAAGSGRPSLRLEPWLGENVAGVSGKF